MCRFQELRNKEVIDICEGVRIGFVFDVEIDVCSGRVVAIIVPGCRGFFWFFGKREDYIIPWCDIRKIGDDIILVNIQRK